MFDALSFFFLMLNERVLSSYDRPCKECVISLNVLRSVHEHLTLSLAIVHAI